MKLKYLLFCMFMLWGGFVDANENKFKYAIDIIQADVSTLLKVTFQFKGSDKGVSQLTLDPNGASGDNKYQIIKNFSLLNSSKMIKVLKNNEQPNAYDLSHDPGADIRVSYEIHIPKKMIEDQYKERGYYPFIEKEFVYFEGRDVFLMPASVNFSDKVNMDVSWNVPSAWKKAQTVQDKLFSLKAVDVKGLAYIAGKHLKVSRVSLNQTQHVHIAVQGDFSFYKEEEASALEEGVRKMFKTLLNFWDDQSPMDYLIVLRTVADIDTDGSAIYETFRANLTKDTPIFYILKLFIHEIFHRYNGKKISFNQHEASLTWFKEGFTDFYTNLLGLKSGIFTKKQFIQHLNKTIQDYLFSPAINATSKQAADLFWKDFDYEKISYNRGHLMAYVLDRQIQRKSSNKFNLDHFMRDLLERIKHEDIARYDQHALIDILESEYEVDATKLLLPYINEGKALNVLEDINLGKCFEVFNKTIKGFDRGFDRSKVKVKGDPFVGVVQGSQAYKAGLRNGQIYMGIDMYRDPSILATVWVKEKGNVRKIQYYPSKNSATIPQVHIKKDKYWQKDKCWKRLLN